MSAAEKLKRLAVSKHPLANPDQGDDHIGGALHDALPEIIAVVEAAEKVRDHDDNDPKPLRPTLEEFYATIAVLDKKLTP